MSTKLLFALSLSLPQRCWLLSSSPLCSLFFLLCSCLGSLLCPPCFTLLPAAIRFISFHFISFHPVPFRYSTLSVCRRLQPASVRYCYALCVCVSGCARECVEFVEECVRVFTYAPLHWPYPTACACRVYCSVNFFFNFSKRVA